MLKVEHDGFTVTGSGDTIVFASPSGPVAEAKVGPLLDAIMAAVAHRSTMHQRLGKVQLERLAEAFPGFPEFEGPIRSLRAAKADDIDTLRNLTMRWAEHLYTLSQAILRGRADLAVSTIMAMIGDACVEAAA
jgi:hypothetical protein